MGRFSISGSLEKCNNVLFWTLTFRLNIYIFVSSAISKMIYYGLNLGNCINTAIIIIFK